MKENPIEKESVELLSRYLKVNTTNPPGNEMRGSDFFADIFKKEGVDFKIYEPQPGRASLRAIIPGTGAKKPVILLNHMDVVPADAQEWHFDPFGGEIKDGFIHGRGCRHERSGDHGTGRPSELKTKRNHSLPGYPVCGGGR